MSADRSDLWQQRFMPDRLAPLPFTSAWGELRPAEQLRYNQLHALYFHEQIIFFEQRIIVPLLRALQPRVRDSALSAALEIFIAEENEHSAEFHALLRQLRPEWYTASWNHFVTLGAVGEAALGAMLRRPKLFPGFLWLVQLLEERTMFASKLWLAADPPLPEPWLALHRRHLIDEADHVKWDTALIAEFWNEASPWVRRANARMIDWLLGEFIAVPRRAALRVIDALAEDRPDLAVPPARLKRELLALGRRPEFRSAVFARDSVPRTWKQASMIPELRGLVATWMAHEHAL